MYEIIIKAEFASAHNLRDYDGLCEALHGHNWKVDIVVESETLDKTGLAIDFKILNAAASEIVNDLDHTYLNDHREFKEKNPSSENIAKYMFDELKSNLPDNVKMKKITIWETDNAAASYYEN